MERKIGNPQVCSGVRATRSLVLYVCFVDGCLSFCIFSFGHYFVSSSSSIYGFLLPLWYLQTRFLAFTINKNVNNMFTYSNYSFRMYFSIEISVAKGLWRENVDVFVLIWTILYF
jgi:hypothetical protein